MAPEVLVIQHYSVALGILEHLEDLFLVILGIPDNLGIPEHLEDLFLVILGIPDNLGIPEILEDLLIPLFPENLGNLDYLEPQ